MKKSDYDYDLAIVGAGCAGLAAAETAVSLGARVALIEAEKVGGAHLFSGGIAHSALLKSARVYDMIKRCEEFGVHVEKPRIVWSAIKLRQADLRDQLKERNKQALQRLGLQPIVARAHFITPTELGLVRGEERTTLSARKFVLATGSLAVPPSLPGLDAVDWSTPQQLFALPSLPRRLTFVGGDGETCELAQAFNRLGSKVTILHDGPQLLEGTESVASDELTRLLRNEGVTVELEARCVACGTEEGEKGTRNWAEFERHGETTRIESGRLVMNPASISQTQGLNLVAAGVKLHEGRIVLDEYLQTTRSHILACGGAAQAVTNMQTSIYQGSLAARNALLPLKSKAAVAGLPHVVHTDPQVASFGRTLPEAQQDLGEARAIQVALADLDGPTIEGDTSGFVRVILSGSGKMVGVTIVGSGAAELVSTFVPAIHSGTLVQEFATMAFPYLTLAEACRVAGERVAREKLETPLAKTVLKKLI